MTYRLAYSTNAYTKWPLSRALEDIKAAGFDGAEILADLPHAFPAAVDPRRLAAQIKRLKLGISNVNGNTSLGVDRDRRDPDGFWPSLLDPDPSARALRIDYVKRVIDLARALGGDTICTASGRKPESLSARAATSHLVDSLAEVLAHARKKPAVHVGIEYEPGFFIGNAKALLSLLNAVDHPLLGANLDLGHAHCVKEDLAETIASLGPRIWNIHIEDIKGRVHDHLVPGRGDIDFARVRKALDKARYARWITLEIYPYKDDPDGAGRKALKHLRRFFE